MLAAIDGMDAISIDRARLRAFDLPGSLADRAQTVEEQFSLRKEGHAVFGQRDARAIAMKQREPKLFLKVLNQASYDRLRLAEHFCRTGHTADRRHRHKGFELSRIKIFRNHATALNTPVSRNASSMCL